MSEPYTYVMWWEYRTYVRSALCFIYHTGISLCLCFTLHSVLATRWRGGQNCSCSLAIIDSVITSSVSLGKTEATGTLENLCGSQAVVESQRCVRAWEVSPFINRLSVYLLYGLWHLHMSCSRSPPTLFNHH